MALRALAQTKDLNISVALPEDALHRGNQLESGDLKQISKIAIQRTLEKTNGNISLAAKLLKISRNTLYRYLK